MSIISQLRRWFARPSRRPTPTHFVLFLILAAFCFFFLVAYDPPLQVIPIETIVVVGKDDMNGVSRKQRVFSTGCTIPKLETYGSEMMSFVEKAKPLNCQERAGSVNWIEIDKKGKLVKRRADAKCKIEYIVRKTDFENELVEAETLVEGRKMKQDFGKVSCTNGHETWESLLMAAVRNETVVQRVKKKIEYKGEKPLDVVIFGFDSMSQQHFRRKMPKTISQLEQMNAVIFNGYNIVGDGTPQAFIPILTGKTELELPNTRRRYATASVVDVYPFIWKNFSDKGYVTLFGEDAFEIGMFSYRLKGFGDQPTDHYTRNFYKEVEAMKGNKRKNGGYCLGSEPAHEAWFRYSRQFLNEYPDLPKFLLMHQDSLSHEDVNQIEVEDEHLAGHLADLEAEGLLDNAVLIVMADHGHRFMKIRNTHQGQLEERLPMFSIVLPKKLRATTRGQQMYANLLANKDVLTTPFDIHQTLLDILNPPEDLSTLQETTRRSLSLFRPIPKTRTCEEAEIEPHWCTCLNWENATTTSLDDEQTKVIAEGLVKAVDNQLAQVKDLCANVTLKKVISASKYANLGYNIVGDGTPQAFIPILTGKTELELPNTRRRYATASVVDVYPFIWKNFSDKGYVTLFGEDAFEIGMFSYRLKGFGDQPTDHYTRNFYKEVEAMKGNKRKNGGYCLGSEPAHEAWFRYSRQFLNEYPDLPKFLLMHQDSLSHEDVNQIEVEDEHLAGHLADLEAEGLLDNAVLIVMADHGHRFMKIRNTHQGQLEERLPMFSIVLPKKLRATTRGQQMYANLLANKDVLTTPFDIHQTLLDILNPPEDLSTLQETTRRSLSLFRPIPKTRTCEEAEIEPHWCTCLNWENATTTSLDDEQTKVIAEGLVKAVDNQLAQVKDLCANVTLKKVISASKLSPNIDLLSYKDVKDTDGFVPAFKANARAVFALYQLKIMTSPNDAIYEATVYFDGRKGSLEVDLQSLSHVNAYGDDPHCVVQNHNTLALYCVCHDRVKK